MALTGKIPGIHKICGLLIHEKQQNVYTTLRKAATPLLFWTSMHHCYFSNPSFAVCCVILLLERHCLESDRMASGV